MNAMVFKINPNTGSKTLLATLPIVSPYSVGFLSYCKGNLYVPSFKHCIYKVDTAGTGYSVFAGSETIPGDVNGEIATALLNTPIATFSSLTGDTLYFTDSGNQKVKKITGLNSTTGVSENHADKTIFEIYTNPTKEIIYIELKVKNETITKVDFMTVDGKHLQNVEFLQSAIHQLYTISSEQLPIGSYLLTVTTSKGEFYSRIIIKL
jgi:hypothetical protein